MLKVEIADGNGGYRAEIRRRLNSDNKEMSPPGLMVYSDPYRLEENRPITAVDAGGSTAMNVNGSTAGGTPDAIHDGTDTTLWTASNLSGTNFVFNSTDPDSAADRSIDAVATVNNNEALLTRASTLTFANYTALTGNIYVDSWPTAGTKEVRFRFRLDGVDIGTTINLSSYINTGTQNTWQSFIIPLTEFALAGTDIDELVITTVDIGGGQPPNYYLDDLSLASTGATGSPTIYTIAPNGGETILIYGFVYNIVFPFNPTATVAGATENFVANQYLSYDKFAHLPTLPNGLTVRRIQDNNVGFSNIVTTNWDLLKATNHIIETFVSDGTNTMLKIATQFTGPVELNGNRGDRYEFIVNDDLTDLLAFEIRGRATTLTPATG